MEWLPLEPIRAMVTRDMYEDDDEFEDAIGGSFEVFMAAMPHVELRTSEQGAAEFRVIQPDPLAGAVTMRMRVSEREDLWRVLFKSPGAVLRIPHMEFEIGASAKRQIDSVYNHIAAAAFELASHVRSLGGQLDAGDAEKIGETAADLYELLDVAEPATSRRPTAASAVAGRALAAGGVEGVERVPLHQEVVDGRAARRERAVPAHHDLVVARVVGHGVEDLPRRHDGGLERARQERQLGVARADARVRRHAHVVPEAVP